MDADLLSIVVKRNPGVPKNLDLVESWYKIRKVLSKEIGGVEYTTVPFLTETNGYKIGNIFVEAGIETDCCKTIPRYKMLGPIQKYISKAGTAANWKSSRFPTVKSTADHRSVTVKIGKGPNELRFTAWEYFELHKPDNMVEVNNITIDRNALGDLSNIEWFAILTDVIMAKSIEFRMNTKHMGRIIYLGEADYPLLFKYTMCQMDQSGLVVRTLIDREKKIKWESLQPDAKPNIPFPLYV